MLYLYNTAIASLSEIYHICKTVHHWHRQVQSCAGQFFWYPHSDTTGNVDDRSYLISHNPSRIFEVWCPYSSTPWRYGHAIMGGTALEKKQAVLIKQRETWMHKGKQKEMPGWARMSNLTRNIWFVDFFVWNKVIFNPWSFLSYGSTATDLFGLLLIHSASTYWAKGTHGMLPSCEISIARKWSINRIVFQNIRHRCDPSRSIVHRVHGGRLWRCL